MLSFKKLLTLVYNECRSTLYVGQRNRKCSSVSVSSPQWQIRCSTGVLVYLPVSIVHVLSGNVPERIFARYDRWAVDRLYLTYCYVM